MQHKLDLNLTITAANETLKYDAGLIKQCADNEYLITRFLIVSSNTLLTAMYHYHHCIETYLKAYLALQEDKDFKLKKKIRNGHDLIKLVELCKSHDSFFQDTDLVNALEQLKSFWDIGRYPNYKVQQYGLAFPQSISFLDEFATHMREYFRPSKQGEDSADNIYMLFLEYKSIIQLPGYQTAISLFDSLRLDNEYMPQIMDQFPKTGNVTPEEIAQYSIPTRTAPHKVMQFQITATPQPPNQ